MVSSLIFDDSHCPMTPIPILPYQSSTRPQKTLQTNFDFSSSNSCKHSSNSQDKKFSHCAVASHPFRFHFFNFIWLFYLFGFIYAITSGAAVVLAGTGPILRQVPLPLPQAALVLRHRLRRVRPEGTLQVAADHGDGGQVERDGHARHRYAGSRAGSWFLLSESEFCFLKNEYGFLIPSCLRALTASCFGGR
jgi:hypothetical protein